MRTLMKGTLVALGVAALAQVVAGPAAAQFGGPPAPPNTGIPVFTHMSGGDGQGDFTGVVDPPKGTFCYLMHVSGLQDITAAHVHIGGPGTDGGPVIPLEGPAEGSAGACVPITAELSAAILGNPGGYYVNVHTRAQPSGAIRGQLAK